MTDAPTSFHRRRSEEVEMFVSGDDFEDWHDEQTLLEFENEFTHVLDFEAWEDELLSPFR